MSKTAEKIKKQRRTSLNGMDKTLLGDIKGCMIARDFLAGRIAGIIEDRKLRSDMVRGKRDACIDIKYDKEHYKVFAAYYNGKYTGYSVVVDITKLAKGSYVTLQASNKDIQKAVIGKCGENVRGWSDELGVKKITVLCKG